MRIGGHIGEEFVNAEQWGDAVKKMGYTATYFPLSYKDDIKDIDACIKEAKDRDLVIAEIGAWCNTLSQEPVQQEKCMNRVVKCLELADYVGAKCCVNIAGSLSDTWDGPHKDHFTQKTFETIVRNTQEIIDRAKPKTTCFSLEPMPWMFPHTPESYLELIKAIDRKQFCAHFDFVNVINSVDKYYNNADVIRDWFTKLKPYAKSCHAKDIIIGKNLTLHFSECRPGTGELHYPTIIELARTMDEDFCVMFEHMTEKEDYVLAMDFIKTVF